LRQRLDILRLKCQGDQVFHPKFLYFFSAGELGTFSFEQLRIKQDSATAMKNLVDWAFISPWGLGLKTIFSAMYSLPLFQAIISALP
jgi:hypothetical protein